ncbi:hypothetical protein ACIBKY_44070 [Nonomuraea sp. NPDC050394]|uniref:hypothetical protein n=1 Tax=Nonomuraea sp. NPDC050394 TaxID=3364363 RepID=UPI003791CB32
MPRDAQAYLRPAVAVLGFPVEFAEYPHKLFVSHERDTAVGGLPQEHDVGPRILAWTADAHSN